MSAVIESTVARAAQPRLLTPLAAARLTAAKCSYATRRLDPARATLLVSGPVAPSAGDLLLARVERIGHHTKLQAPDGRRATLFAGDEIVVCYANRYAPDQFEAEVPDNLDACELVAGGGIAARAVTAHARMSLPTRLQPLGLLADGGGRVLNVADFALPRLPTSLEHRRPVTLAVVGTSMNAGKTTTAAYLIRGLHNAGLRVAAAKVTGTGAGNDTGLMRDAGAAPVLDFTDIGFASTYRVPQQELEQGISRLLDHLAATTPDVVVLEVADGLYQAETAALLKSTLFADRVDALLFAAQDAMGASMGVDWLERRGLCVVAVAGTLTASPLATRETAAATHLPVLTLADLASSTVATQVLADARRAHAGARA